MRARLTTARRALALGALATLSACSAERLTAPGARPAERPALTVAAASLTPPALPQTYLNTAYVAPTGRTHTVNAGGSVQAAINAAAPGDVVVLQAGATFTGNFYLPKKSGAGWVTIRTSTDDAQLPAGVRVSPADAPRLARLVSPNSDAALRTSTGAHHYRIVGLEVTAATSVTSALGLVHLGTASTTSQATPAAAPSHIVLDRSYVHGRATLDLKNCVTLHAASAAIVDSYLAECHHKTVESHGIIATNGPGPFKIENNYVEAGHINVMLGGSNPASAEMMPSDVEFRRNHVVKPLAWKGVWPAKNLMELKIGQRILVEDNVFENSWYDQQKGFAFNFKTSVTSGASAWGRTQDVTVRYNVVRNAAAGASVSARDGSYGLPARRFRFEHNLWDGIGAAAGTTYGRMFQVLSGVNVVQVEHNTAIHSAAHAEALLRFGTGVDTNVVFRDNLATRGGTGVAGDGVAEGTPALDRYAPGYRFTNNVLVAASASRYPSGNYFASALSAVGFVNLTGGDYRLAATSPYKGKASDGTDPGADVDRVNARTAGVVR